MGRELLVRLAWIPILVLAFFAAQLLLASGHLVLLGLLGFFLALAVVFWLDETALPVVLILTLALGSAYKHDLAQKSFYVRFFVLGLIALRGFLVRGASRRHGFLWMEAALYIFSALGVASFLYSVAPSVSFQRAASFFLLLIVVFHYFSSRAGDVEACEKYARALWLTALIILGFGFTLLAIRFPGMFYAGRLRLVLGNPNQLGHYCALVAPIALWFASDRATGKAKVVAWGLFAAIGVAALWSGSRAALVSICLSLLLQCVLCYRKKLVYFTMTIGLAVALHLLLSSGGEAPENDPTFFQEHVLRGGELATGSGRTEVWKAARRLIGQRPFFGYGFGIVDRMFEKGYFPEFVAFQGGHVHNSYLEELVNVGWVGATPLFVVLFGVLVMGAASLLGPMKRSNGYRVAVALYCAILAGLVSGIFESWFTSVGSVFCFPFWFMTMLFLKTVGHLNDWSRTAAG